MLERNKRIKPVPERFQDSVEEFDVIFTVEERIYDAVLEGLCTCYECSQYVMFPLITTQYGSFRDTGISELHTGPGYQHRCERQS